MLILRIVVVFILCLLGSLIENSIKSGENKYLFGYFVGVIVMFCLNFIDKFITINI